MVKHQDRRRRAAILAAVVAAGLLATANWWWQQSLACQFAAVDRAYRHIPSPNYNDRPLGTTVDCVVLHSTADTTLQSTATEFENPASQVSSHFVVDKDGTVVMAVPIEKRAWHAGASALGGRRNVNDFSVGIEMVNDNDGVDPYTDAQYTAVARIIRRLRTCCDIPDSRIVSHASIALPRGRKTDPKGFDWPRLRRLVDR